MEIVKIIGWVTGNVLFLIIFIIITFLFFRISDKIFNGQSSIDIVITYVNDKDPHWLAQKELYLKENKEPKTIFSTKNWRYTSNDEIIYCLLGIQKNMTFIRNIYVTVSSYSQLNLDKFKDVLEPKFINKIKIIKHSDFFINTLHLPTFNSLSIEANIHNIQGLSDNFIYFNDDCFVTKPVTEGNFISILNNLLIRKENTISPTGIPTVNDSGFYAAWKNTNRLLDTIKKETNRKMIQHVPQIQKISIHKKLWEIFPKEMEITSSSKFRNKFCNLINGGLAEYYSFYDNKAVSIENNEDYLQVFIKGKETFQELAKLDKNDVPMFLNIQNATEEEISEEFKRFFNKIF